VGNNYYIEAKYYNFGDTVYAAVIPYDYIQYGDTYFSGTVVINDPSPFTVASSMLDNKNYINQPAALVFQFNRKYSRLTIDTDSIVLYNIKDSRKMDIKVSFDNTNSVLYCTPVYPDTFSVLGSYSMVLNSQIKDKAGNSLNRDYRWEFNILMNRSSGFIKEFSNSLGRVTVNFNEVRLDKDLYIAVNDVDLNSLSGVRRPGTGVPFNAYEIEIYDNGGNKMEYFDTAIPVVFYYYDNDNDGYIDGTNILEQNLKIFRLNPEKNKWELPGLSTVDPVNNTITARVHYFSIYCIMEYTTVTNLKDSFINFPNPFNPYRETTKFEYLLKYDATVNMRIFTLTGEPVRNLLEDLEQTAGQHGIQTIGEDIGLLWDGKNEDGNTVENGVYFCQLMVIYKNGVSETVIKKIAVVK